MHTTSHVGAVVRIPATDSPQINEALVLICLALNLALFLRYVGRYALVLLPFCFLLGGAIAYRSLVDVPPTVEVTR